METKSVAPVVGLSASYGIGSDSYHQIVVSIPRAGRTVVTTDARNILNALGVTLDEWNSRNWEEKFVETEIAFQKVLNEEIEYEISWKDCSRAEAERWAMAHLTKKFTIREDGRYRPIGENFGNLCLDSESHYQSPEF